MSIVQVMAIPHVMMRLTSVTGAKRPSSLTRLSHCTAPATVAPARIGVAISPSGVVDDGRGSRRTVAASMSTPHATQRTGTQRHEASPTIQPVNTGRASQTSGDTIPKVPKAAARARGSENRSDSRPMPMIWIAVAAIPSMRSPTTTAGRPCAIPTTADPTMKATDIQSITVRWPLRSPSVPARKTTRSDAIGGIDKAMLA